MTFKDYIGETSEIARDYWHEIKIGIYFIFGFLQMDINIVKILSILMIIDTVLGVWKSVRVNHLKFTFKKLLWGIVSKATILLIPMILALTALAIGFDFRWLVELVLKILVVSEALSSITNIISIKENKNLENTDFVSVLLHGIRDFFKKYLDKLFQKLN